MVERGGKNPDIKEYHQEILFKGLPGGPVVKTSPSNAGSTPGQGVKIPHASWPKNKIQKQYCNRFNKDFKNGPY